MSAEPQIGARKASWSGPFWVNRVGSRVLAVYPFLPR